MTIKEQIDESIISLVHDGWQLEPGTTLLVDIKRMCPLGAVMKAQGLTVLGQLNKIFDVTYNWQSGFMNGFDIADNMSDEHWDYIWFNYTSYAEYVDGFNLGRDYRGRMRELNAQA